VNVLLNTALSGPWWSPLSSGYSYAQAHQYMGASTLISLEVISDHITKLMVRVYATMSKSFSGGNTKGRKPSILWIIAGLKPQFVALPLRNGSNHGQNPPTQNKGHPPEGRCGSHFYKGRKIGAGRLPLVFHRIEPRFQGFRFSSRAFLGHPARTAFEFFAG